MNLSRPHQRLPLAKNLTRIIQYYPTQFLLFVAHALQTLYIGNFWQDDSKSFHIQT
jgi:hypothetical protein